MRTTVVTDVAGDQDSKSKEGTGGDFGAPHCSWFLSYSNRPSIAIQTIGPQVTANRFDQRSGSPQFKQPSSTSTVSLSTVRRGGLSTSTTKSDAMHELAGSVRSFFLLELLSDKIAETLTAELLGRTQNHPGVPVDQ
jgi:hypothetical protein